MKSAFQDKVAWITGGGSGIGRSLAIELSRRGASVAVSGRRRDRLEEVVRAIEGVGGRAIAVACDVTDEADIERAVAEVVTALGRLDVAVANAGYAVGGHVETLTADDWRRQLETNVVGLAVTARHAIPHLEATRGRLVLVGSVASMVVRPGSGAYSASKAAVRAIGQALSAELHGRGVTCTTIHPGFVTSEIGQVDNDGVYHPERKDKRPQGLMWTSERAAEVMARVIERRPREHVFTAHGKAAGFIGRHAPGLMHAVMARTTVGQPKG